MGVKIENIWNHHLVYYLQSAAHWVEKWHESKSPPNKQLADHAGIINPFFLGGTQQKLIEIIQLKTKLDHPNERNRPRCYEFPIWSDKWWKAWSGLVVEPTHLKNMLVKNGKSPQGWKQNIFETTTLVMVGKAQFLSCLGPFQTFTTGLAYCWVLAVRKT